MTAVELALLAVMAAAGGDSTTAGRHIASAHRQSRVNARRERQVIEIAALIIDGNPARAAGLALEHLAAFPGDADLLAHIAPTGR